MPEKFGRYELLSLIGRGGMAELYRARLEVPAGVEKILVVKRILPTFSSDPEFLRMFVNEAKIALPLTHGNITAVFEFGEVGGTYFLAMEYIHGQNLDAVLRRTRELAIPMPIEAALFIASEVAKGLSYAHGFTSPQGQRVEIVHLDVSPQNFLISYDGGVKLTDFGIAKVKQSTEPQRGVLRGKPSYLAPEQLDGGTLDPRTDIFSLGSVLYQMLTGVPPFRGETDEETLEMVRQGDVKKPSSVRPGLEPFDALVMKALAVKPEDRYTKTGDFTVAITQALYERSPGYGSQELAEWIREIFAWDLFESQGNKDENAPRDRLLFQLTNAKVEFDAKRSTKELLSLGTVSIPPLAPPPPPVRDPRELRAKIATVLLFTALTAFAAALIWALGRQFFGEEVRGLGAQTPGQTADPSASPAVPGASGSLSLNAWPSAIVYLNGERLAGSTPIFNITVPAGRHTLRFERPEFGMKKEVDVVIPPGGSRTVAVTLDR